jgi:hypothetical protein
MKAFLAAGLVVLGLGVLSFFVPLPHREDHSMTVGDFRLGVQTQSSERVSPAVSLILVLVGAGLMLAGGRGPRS